VGQQKEQKSGTRRTENEEPNCMRGGNTGSENAGLNPIVKSRQK